MFKDVCIQMNIYAAILADGQQHLASCYIPVTERGLLCTCLDFAGMGFNLNQVTGLQGLDDCYTYFLQRM